MPAVSPSPASRRVQDRECEAVAYLRIKRVRRCGNRTELSDQLGMRRLACTCLPKPGNFLAVDIRSTHGMHQFKQLVVQLVPRDAQRPRSLNDDRQVVQLLTRI